MDIQGFIFDMDGTILDSMPLWKNAGTNYLDSLGVNADLSLNRILFNMSMKEGAEYLKKNFLPFKSTDEILDGISESLFKDYKTKVLLKPNVKEILHYLKEIGIKLALVTATERKLFTPALERLGVLNLFDFTITCSECGKPKSKPDIYYKAAEALFCNTENAIVCEDALMPIKTALEGGFKTLAVYDESNDKDWQKIKALTTLYIEDWRDFDFQNLLK